MLSNLASYLGYSSAPVERAPPAGITADVRVRDEEDDDWVLVEPNEREGAGAAEDDPGMTRVTLAVSACPSNLPGASSPKSLSRSASADVSCHLQESWYLTPPPSFTSTGPVHMETSPLENMLIEHPSMSVYEHTSLSGGAGDASDEDPAIRPASPARLPRKDKLGKVPRNKIAAKYPKKVAAKRATEDGVRDAERPANETKEPKMKNFVKSPRGSQRVPNVSRTQAFDRVISDSEKCETGATNEFQVVPTRKLYSEVLASKPVAVQEKEEVPPPTTTTAEAKEQEVPETPNPPPQQEEEEEQDGPTAKEVAVAEGESSMSVEEDSAPEVRTDPESERRRTVQTISDHQQRQNFLNRSAQKVEQRKTCDLMKRNPLIRTNKAREINFRNKRQRRADMMQRHSGANNNRKC